MIDQFENENMQIKYCLTDKTWGNFMTKPMQGANFKNFINYVFGESK